jgi:hypothetical protein
MRLLKLLRHFLQEVFALVTLRGCVVDWIDRIELLNDILGFFDVLNKIISQSVYLSVGFVKELITFID